MGWLPLPYRLLLIAACVIAAGLGGYFKGRSDANMAALAREQAALIEFNHKLQNAGVQHDEDQAVINRLSADVGRVRVHIPACPTVTANPDGSAGVFSDRVDALFAELQDRTGALIQRCDQLNIDARRANAIGGRDGE